jgi:Carboxylesterase family
MGILTIVPDYRNFPQGDVEDMVTDVIAAVSWTSKNAESYGGDPEKIVLAGQSAGTTANSKCFVFLQISWNNNQLIELSLSTGAHICMCALMDALRARIENQTNLKRYPVLSKPDNGKVQQNSKKESGIWENLMLPVRSLNGRNSFFDGISPILGHSAFAKKKEDTKSVQKIVNNNGTNEDFGGFQTNNDSPDTENEDEDDDDNEEEEDEGTWKSSATPVKNSMKEEKPMVIDTSTPPKEPSEMSHSEKLSKSNLFTKLESPHRVREIPVLVGSVFRNTGSDIRNGVENVYKELMEKVEGVSADLAAEGEDLKNLSQRPVTHDPLDLTVIKLFIGISGPYNLLALSSHMQSRGLDHSILKWICRGDVKKYSPVLHLDSIMSRCLSTASSPTSSEKKLRGKSSSSKENPTNSNTSCFFDNHQATDVNDRKASQKIIPDTTVMNSVEDFNSVKNTDLRSESVSSSSKYSDNEKSVDNENENENGLDRITLNGLCFPPVALFHGAEDISVPSSVSVEMAAAICRWGGEVSL